MSLLSEVLDDSILEADCLCLVFPMAMTVMNLDISLIVGSNTNHCSGKGLALLALGRHVDRTRESDVNQAFLMDASCHHVVLACCGLLKCFRRS